MKPVILHYLAVVGTGGIEEKRGLAFGTSVHHDEGAVCFRHDTREGVEHRHFLGRGRSEIFSHKCAVRVVYKTATRRDDLFDVARRHQDGIDAVEGQSLEGASTASETCAAGPVVVRCALCPPLH